MTDISALPRPLDGNLGRPMWIGALVTSLLLGTLVTWAALTPIAGAVIAGGQAEVAGEPQKVQSLDGGIVSEIDVASGDRVAAGQVLVRLDPTLLKLDLDAALGQLAEALALKSRLEAEQAGLAAPDFTYAPLPFPRPDTSHAEAGQRQIFAARAALMAEQRKALTETRDQVAAQRAGLNRQIAVFQDQLKQTEAEQTRTDELAQRGLTRSGDQLTLVKQRSDILAQISSLQTESLRLAASVQTAQTDLQQKESSFHEDVGTKLRDTSTKIATLVPQIRTLMAKIDRTAIRAPAAGVVHEMTVTTPGGVVAPGSTILQVIPQDRGLDFTVKLNPRYIDQVHAGQSAEISLAGLDPRTTPKLKATVMRVSPDTITDSTTKQSYYRVRMTIPPKQMDRLGKDVSLVPGMPIEAFISTEPQSVLHYLVRPLTVNLERAFRER